MRIGRIQVFYFSKKKERTYAYFPFYLLLSLPLDIQLIFIVVCILAVTYVMQDLEIRRIKGEEEEVEKRIKTFNQQKKLREIDKAQDRENVNINNYF